MLAAGCAVNELTASDYGFDLHVLLPERYPGTAKRWAMSPRSALIQVKGGASFDDGVRLKRSMWRYYLRASTPVYLAVIPREGQPWIELVDRLVGRFDVPATPSGGDDGNRTALLSPDSGTEMWIPRLFAEDARLQAAADGRRTRRKLLSWADASGDEDADDGFVRTIGELAFALTGDYENLASRVREYVADAVPDYEDDLMWRSDYGFTPLDDDWLPEHLSSSEFILPGGERSQEALTLKTLVEDLADEVSISDLVLSSHREHFGTEDHMIERGYEEELPQ
jgi:hypothetical protein